MKKSRFLTFVLAIMPGCGLMYLGYMKKGLQTMLMFGASLFLSIFFAHDFEWIMTLFILLMPVIWFYQMFDSMHLISRMKRQEIETPEDDGFYLPQELHKISPVYNRTAAKITAAVLIFVGGLGLVYMVLDNLYRVFDYETIENTVNVIRDYLASAIVSVALIIIGVMLLRGKKPKKTDAGKNEKE